MPMMIGKMILKNFVRINAILFVISAIFLQITSTTVSPQSRQDHHRSSSLIRDNLPSWFRHREETSMNDHLSSNVIKHEIDENHRHTRHEIISRSKSRNGARILHDGLLKNSRNHFNEAISTPMIRREGEKIFYDSRAFEDLTNETPGRVTSAKSSWNVRNTKNNSGKLFETKDVRPTTMTMMRTSRDSRVEDSANKPEKLTAVAVAEFTGTRAVTYAGYHQHNLDYNPTRTREILTPGYAIVATSATPTYTKHHAGRRVCSRQTPNSIAHNHRSRQYRLMYTELSSSTFLCCPGWSQVSRTSYGCNRPTCSLPCLNGGVCGPHGKCNCPKAFTGTQCQTDVDECVTEKPCGQLCTNLPGSYECQCRYGFHLQPDGQSCRKNGSDGTAFEARDLENDYGFTMTSTTTETTRRTTPTSHDTENEVGEGNVDQDYEIILKRLAKLEKQIARGRKRDSEAQEMSTKISQAVEGVAAMRRAIDNVQLMQQEIYDMRGKVKQFELESRKLQHLTNRVADLETRLRLRCRNSING